MDRDFKKRDGEEHVVDLLSAYIDNALSPAERESVHAHIETCASCRSEHKSLAGTQVMLKSLPVVPPPRAFTLTPEMVGAAAPRESFWQRLLTPRAVPRFATGSVVAFALLVFLLLGDLTGVRQNSPSAAYETSLRQEAPVRGANAEQNTALQSDATVGAAAGSNDSGVALVPPTAPTLPPIAQGGVEATAGTMNDGVTASGTPETLTKTFDPFASATSGTSDTSMKQPAPDVYVGPQSVPAEDSPRSMLPALELVLAAIGTALAIGAVVARRRGI